MTKIINLFAGPGSGKSTTAALLFGKMKLAGYNCELVTEFAKRLTWESRKSALNNQAYVFGKQLHYLDNIVGQVDYIITDSPILLSAIYKPEIYPKTFIPFVLDIFNYYNNINFFIRRIKPYNPIGRNQTEDEAKLIDDKIYNFLHKKNIDFLTVLGDERAPQKILDYILEE